MKVRLQGALRSAQGLILPACRPCGQHVVSVRPIHVLVLLIRPWRVYDTGPIECCARSVYHRMTRAAWRGGGRGRVVVKARQVCQGWMSEGEG